jgi:type I restriction enzyme S subunit
MKWKKIKLGEVLKESRILSENPNPDRRITVRLNVLGVEKRPLEKEKSGATKQFIRKAGQFIYGKQNFHKGAFGIIPNELDGFESSADLPSFDVREDCLPEWIFYFFKQGGFYLELAKIARGVATQRIHPEQIYDLEIPLPDIETQKKIIAKIKAIEGKADKLKKQLSHQLTLLDQLNQAILQEAVQGKLVPQDPSDEPASELLKRIKAEKLNGSYPSGRRKKEKPLPPIKPEEIPFEIPENWVWCRLGEIAYVTSGSTPSKDAFVDEGIPFLKMYNLKSQEIDFYYKPQYIKEEVHNGQLKRCRAYPGDILMNIVGPPLGKIAIIPESLPECNFNQAAVLIRPMIKECNKYIFWFLNEMSEINAIDTKGVAGQDNISVTQAQSIKIPLPPISEQKRIVAEIERQLAKTKQIKEHIIANQQATEQLLKALLHQAFEVKENEEHLAKA